MKRRIENINKKNVLRNTGLLILILALATLLCIAFSELLDMNRQYSLALFILAVSLIARFTDGYAYGVVASLLSVVCVNYMFTYPYWEFNLTIAGYPITFAVMLIVSILISTLTTQIKKQEKLRMVAEMEKMRANLLRSVSHDLRTPLTSIIGASSVLLENDEMQEEERRELVEEINKDARWLVRVTENILSVTKFSGTGVALKKEFEVAEEVVSGAIVKFRKNHPDMQILVHKPEEILLAPMDATLIEQVIINLFDNVCEHGKDASSIEVEIALKDEFVYITVSDNGAGIPAAKLPILFEGRIAASESAVSDNRRNMGIGLAVCRSIIRAHGGEIRAYNNDRGGASIEFKLPASEEDENEQA